MKIPLKYQVFEAPVEISSKDHERLSFYVGSWKRIHEMMLLGVNQSDLRRLVVLELMGRRRIYLIRRLLGRLTTLQRNDYLSKVLKAAS